MPDRCHYYLEGGWGWVVLSAGVVCTLLTSGCQWTVVYYMSRPNKPPSNVNWPVTLLPKGKIMIPDNLTFKRPQLDIS